MNDPDERQQIINAPQSQDDAPVTITHFQAMKCAAILDAIVAAHDAYKDLGSIVAQFLQTRATEAAFGDGVVFPSSESLWIQIEKAPWPVSGPPRSQPDVS